MTQSSDQRPPPPDPNKPYIWIGGEWLLVATDTADGVPDSLDLEHGGAPGKALDRGEQDLHHALMLVDPTARTAVLELLGKKQGRDRRGRFASGGGVDASTNLMGGPLRSSIPGQPGGPPLPRASLAKAKTTEEVAAVTSRELEGVMGREVPVDFSGLSPAMARETGEGLLIAAQRYPRNNLRAVTTYGPGGTHPTHPGDPNFEAAALTATRFSQYGVDDMAFSTFGGEKRMRAQYAESAIQGLNSTPSPTGVAVHEMGHVVSLHSSADVTSTEVLLADAERAGSGKTGSDVAVHIAQNVSIYASSSPEEAMAEAFADVLVNGSGASRLSQDVHSVIDGYYQSANLP